MKKFDIPELEVTAFQTEDIITSSSPITPDGDEGGRHPIGG
jgi:hypothetical protein